MMCAFNAVRLTKMVRQQRSQRLFAGYCLFSLVLAVISSNVPAQTDAEVSVNVANERAAIEVITVQNRDPAFVRAAIRPMLDPRGSISQVDNKLIVATTASNLQQIKTLIEQTDLPARRLVVSVDFDHGSPAARPGSTSVAAQQSMQAVEGDTLVFFSGSNSTEEPQLTVKSSIESTYADTEIVISNVPGFTGLHRVQLTLGEWYIINPEQSPDEVVESMLDGALADIPEQPVSNALLPPFVMLVPPIVETNIEASRQAAIAVRVDVLP